jgi:hypothetical protein
MDTEVNVIGMELKNVKDRLKDAMETVISEVSILLL